MSGHGWIYVLLLRDKKIYVGYTERGNMQRIVEHFLGIGARWTQIYSPVMLLAWYEGSKTDEEIITLELMRSVGWQNVRGGKHVRVDMNSPPEELLTKESKLLLVRVQNIMDTKRSDFEVDKLSIPAYHGRCIRCARYGHNETYCMSRAYTRGRCLRCNHIGHDSNDCHEELFRDD